MCMEELISKGWYLDLGMRNWLKLTLLQSFVSKVLELQVEIIVLSLPQSLSMLSDMFPKVASSTNKAGMESSGQAVVEGWQAAVGREE